MIKTHFALASVLLFGLATAGCKTKCDERRDVEDDCNLRAGVETTTTTTGSINTNGGTCDVNSEALARCFIENKNAYCALVWARRHPPVGDEAIARSQADIKPFTDCTNAALQIDTK